MKKALLNQVQHIVLLLLIFILSISFITSCTKKSDNNKKEKYKANPKEFAKELDFSYFPADATAIAVIDFQSIYQVKVFNNMLKSLFDKIKKGTGLDASKIKSLSAFLSIKDLKTNPFSNVAVILDGLDISKIKDFPETVKVEKFEGLSISIFDDRTGFVFVNNKTIGGTIVSVKNAISLSRGKAKNLASTPRNNDFKDIISKLEGSQLSISFVSNEETDIEIKKLASNPQLAMISDFLSNLKSGAFGLKVDEKNIKFTFIAKSSKTGVESLATLANLQIKQLSTAMIDAKLKIAEPIITPEGIIIARNMINSIRINATGEYLRISFNLTVEDAMKIPEIFMKLGLLSEDKINKLKQRKANKNK